MNDTPDPSLDVIEQRLRTRGGHRASTEHRDRVLAAVRNALAGGPRPMLSSGSSLGPRDTAALVSMALAGAIWIVGPWLVVPQAVAPRVLEPAIVVQARAAGIDLSLAAVAAADHGVGLQRIPSPPRPSRHRDGVRWRHYFEGDL